MESSKNPIEVIALTPLEEALFLRHVGKYPDMDRESWKELRGFALATKAEEARRFWIVNEILANEKPNSDEMKELSIKKI